MDAPRLTKLLMEFGTDWSSILDNDIDRAKTQFTQAIYEAAVASIPTTNERHKPSKKIVGNSRIKTKHPKT